MPVIGELRDTQNYVQLAARGLTVFDIAPGRVQRDLEQWQPICQWLDSLKPPRVWAPQVFPEPGCRGARQPAAAPLTR